MEDTDAFVGAADRLWHDQHCLDVSTLLPPSRNGWQWDLPHSSHLLRGGHILWMEEVKGSQGMFQDVLRGRMYSFHICFIVNL